MSLLTYLTAFWGIFEPFSAGILFLLRFIDRKKQRTSYREFTILSERAYDLTTLHIERFGLKRNKFAPRSKKEYVDEIKDKINFKNGSFEYSKGEIELFFLSKYILPKKNRINQFLIVSFYYVEGYLTFLPFLLRREKVIKFFTKKKTFFHYLTIHNWSSKSHSKLSQEVEKIIKIAPILNEKYKLERAESIIKNNPSISKTLDIVLNKGKITERTIFNLATSEKLVIVHKYGEGFGTVFNEYKSKISDVKKELNKARKSIAQNAKKRVEKLSALHKKLADEWPRVPLNAVLEQKGFQTIFNNLKGVYVYPLSMLPEKYQKNHRQYFEDIIIPESDNYLENLKQNNQIVQNNIIELKYIFLTHIIPINELEIFTKGRKLEVSSKALSKMLLSSFLSKEDSQLSSIYINDLIRNVDFKDLINESSKTGEYIIRNFENLKEILYKKFSIDIYKPITLISLTTNQIEEIVNELLLIDDSGTKRFLLKTLNEKVEFYQELNSELNAILKSKNVANTVWQ